MPNEEKRSWINGIVTVAGYVTYLILVLSQAGTRPLVDVAYQVPLLSVIGGAIVASIVLSIFAGIDVPRGVTHKDQRDREIAALGEKVGRSFVVIGGITALILAMLEIDWFWIANALYLGFAISSLLDSITRVVLYRKGMPQW